MNDDETRHFKAHLMTADEFEARRVERVAREERAAKVAHPFTPGERAAKVAHPFTPGLARGISGPCSTCGRPATDPAHLRRAGRDDVPQGASGVPAATATTPPAATFQEHATAFLVELDALCRRFNVALDHEDEHGNFIIERGYSPQRAKWLREARIESPERPMPMPFVIARHNDPTYAAPAPWNYWDHYAGCWCCRECGAASGYHLHNASCKAK